jgi:predicted RNase H-like HicB family nuclease
MADEFSYTFRRHSIELTREREDRNWYIRVRAPSGLHAYDGYWLDSAGKSLKEALQRAKEGAMLVKPRGVQGIDGGQQHDR